MRIFDLFENAEPSDDELFGGDESWGAIPSIIKMLRGYHTSTMADLDSYDGDVRDELEDEAEQADWIATVLARGEKQKGIELLLSLDHQTRGTMTEFLKSYNVDMAKVYSSILGTTPHWLTEGEPSDDELFGGDIDPQLKIIKAIDQQIEFNKSQLRIISINARVKNDADSALIEQRQKYIKRLEEYKQAFKSSLRNGVALWHKDISHVLDMSTTPPSKNKYYHLAVLVSSDAKDIGINLYDLAKSRNLQEGEPSDDELFGASKYNIAEIVDLLVAIGTHYHRTSDAELVLDDADVVLDAADNFQKRGMRAGADRLMDVNQPSVMSYLTAMFREKLGVNINDMFNEFGTDMHESTEPNDDELFGDDIQIQSRAIAILDRMIEGSKANIQQVLAAIGKNSIDDVDPEEDDNAFYEIHNDLEAIRHFEYFISEFKKSPTHGLVAWHNESMGLGHDGTAAAEDFEWNFNQQYDVKLQDYFDELNESAEPSDSDLFGDEDIQLQTRAIKVLDELIANTNTAIRFDLRELGVSSVNDLDPWENEAHEEAYDEIHADLRAIKNYEFFKQEFKKSDVAGLVAWHNETIQGDDGMPAAEMLEYKFEQEYGITLQSYFDELNESAEPSDDELFGEVKYDHRKIGDVVALLGQYIVDHQDDENISDEDFGDANVLLIAGNKFKNQGMLAGIKSLEFMESLSVWEQLETDLYHDLKIDLNEMIDAYTSAG